MKKLINILGWVGIGIIAAIILSIIIGFVVMLTPHTSYIHAINTKEYVAIQGSNEDYFPNSATDIHYATSSVGMGGRAHIFKFNAPLEDCKTFAKQEFNRWVKQLYKNPSDYPSDELIPLDVIPEDPRPFLKKSYGLKNLDWFDCQNITDGVTIPVPRSHLPIIWIDREKQALYSYWTD
jgi:hypothetical protein